MAQTPREARAADTDIPACKTAWQTWDSGDIPMSFTRNGHKWTVTAKGGEYTGITPWYEVNDDKGNGPLKVSGWNNGGNRSC